MTADPSSLARSPAIFLDGWSIAETPVFVETTDTEVHLYRISGELLRSWDAAGLHCDAMQEGGVIHVVHASAQQETLVVRDPALERRMRALCPKVEALPGGSRQLRFGMMCLVALIVLGGTIHHFTPQIARAIAHQIPLQEERALGAQVEALLGFAHCSDAAGEAALSKLAKKLAGSRAEHYETRIIHTAQPNAFALPGGVIVMTDALLKQAESADEIAGVLAHEMEHVSQRHVLAGFVRDTLLSGLWAITMGDYAGLFVVDPTTAYHVANLEFSREDENAADQGALRRLHAAGWSHAGLIKFFDRFDKKLGDGGPAWMSTHPSTTQRLATLRAAKDVAHPASALTASELSALRNACRAQAKGGDDN